jgi:hypothetical protein
MSAACPQWSSAVQVQLCLSGTPVSRIAVLCHFSFKFLPTHVVVFDLETLRSVSASSLAPESIFSGFTLCQMVPK